MATPLSLTSSFTPSSTLLHPSTLHLRGAPKLPISTTPGHKFRNRRHFPLIINKIEPDPEKPDEDYDVGVRAALSMLNFYKSAYCIHIFMYSSPGGTQFQYKLSNTRRRCSILKYRGNIAIVAEKLSLCADM